MNTAETSGENPEADETDLRSALEEEFQQHFPDGRIEWGSITALPEPVRAWFEERAPGIHAAAEQGALDGVVGFSVDHSDGSTSYGAIEEIPDSEASLPRRVWLRDVDVDGEPTGFAALAHNATANESDKDIPFMDYTVTESGYQRRGLAERRLLVMDALSWSLYAKPISSSRYRHDHSEGLWAKQVTAGRAHRTGDRYSFNV